MHKISIEKLIFLIQIISALPESIKIFLYISFIKDANLLIEIKQMIVLLSDVVEHEELPHFATATVHEFIEDAV